MSLMRLFSAAVFVVLFALPVYGNGVQPIPVVPVDSPPLVDGSLAEWGESGWNNVTVKPAIKEDKLNFTGTLDVSLKAVTSGGHIYIAVRWPDDREDVQYKNWVWFINKYRRDKKLDDMFSVRFHMSGDYDATMISEKTYSVDVWVWTAGRSNPSGYAIDATHRMSTDMIEDAAEYKLPSEKIVFIKKNKDAGNPSYETRKPKNRKKFEGDTLISIRTNGNPTGSVADVQAKGTWKDGHWHVEFGRKRDTGHDDDVVFTPGLSILGAIAVYNRGELEHKSASGSLLFEFN